MNALRQSVLKELSDIIFQEVLHQFHLVTSATFTDIRFTPGLPHQPIEFEDTNESHSETQSIKFQDQPNQFEGFDLIEPQTQQEQQEELQQQQEQLANGCFIQQCDQTITGRQLLYSR